MCASFMCTLHKRRVSELDDDERKGETLEQVLCFSSASPCGQVRKIERDEEVEEKEDEQRDAMRDGEKEKKYLMVPS